MTIARLLPVLILRKTRSEHNVRHFKATTLTLESAMPVPMEVDGELAGHLPARVSIRPKALRVIAP